jgi:hypothetical protein
VNHTKMPALKWRPLFFFGIDQSTAIPTTAYLTLH